MPFSCFCLPADLTLHCRFGGGQAYRRRGLTTEATAAPGRRSENEYLFLINRLKLYYYGIF